MPGASRTAYRATSSTVLDTKGGNHRQHVATRASKDVKAINVTSQVVRYFVYAVVPL
jgi:hypothetical protein